MIARPYLLGGLALAWLGSLAAVGVWQNKAGETAERVLWQARENETLRQAQAEVVRLQAEARAKEKAYSEALVASSVRYQNELKNANESHQRLVAELRAGTLRLRDQYAARVPACPGGAGEAAPGAGRRDGASGAELSAEASRFLLDLTHEANDVVRQLSACQDVVRADRLEKETPR